MINLKFLEDDPTSHLNGDFMKYLLQCPICLDYLDSACDTSCGHSYCKECILKFLRFSNRCPVCRSSIRFVTGSLKLRKLVELQKQFDKKNKIEIDDSNDKKHKSENHYRKSTTPSTLSSGISSSLGKLSEQKMSKSMNTMDFFSEKYKHNFSSKNNNNDNEDEENYFSDISDISLIIEEEEEEEEEEEIKKEKRFNKDKDYLSNLEEEIESIARKINESQDSDDSHYFDQEDNIVNLIIDESPYNSLTYPLQNNRKRSLEERLQSRREYIFGRVLDENGAWAIGAILFFVYIIFISISTQIFNSNCKDSIQYGFLFVCISGLISSPLFIIYGIITKIRKTDKKSDITKNSFLLFQEIIAFLIFTCLIPTIMSGVFIGPSCIWWESKPCVENCNELLIKIIFYVSIICWISCLEFIAWALPFVWLAWVLSFLFRYINHLYGKDKNKNKNNNQDVGYNYSLIQ